MAQAQDRKGTPFEHFQRVLWTNQKPAFRALDQSEASILARFSDSVQSGAIQCCVTQIRLKAGSVNSVPVCHWSATQTTPLPMEPNSWPIMQLICQFATLLSTEPLLSHLNHWDATQKLPSSMGPSLYSTAFISRSAPRLFPSIEGNDRGAGPEMNFSLLTAFN